jgi:dihydropyrimidinase
MSRLDTIIRGGRVATATDTVACDVGIRDGRIAALAAELRGADEVIDARGKLVLLGGIDGALVDPARLGQCVPRDRSPYATGVCQTGEVGG